MTGMNDWDLKEARKLAMRDLRKEYYKKKKNGLNNLEAEERWEEVRDVPRASSQTTSQATVEGHGYKDYFSLK